MREIKFRGKDFNRNWREGDLIYATLGAGQKPMIMDAYDEFDLANNMFEVAEETVGQFTGLTDEDGREIYEGDVVRIDDWSSPSYIRWDDVTTSFVVDRWSVNLAHVSQIKVIGNVHDNPELLTYAKD